MKSTFTCFLLYFLLPSIAFAQSSSRTGKVKSSRLELVFDARGQISGLKDLKRNLTVPFTAFTALARAETGTVKTTKIPGGGVAFVRQITQKGQGARLTERLVPEGEAIRWEIEISGDGQPWSTAVETTWQIPNNSQLKCWTTWGDPRLEQSDVAMTAAQARDLLDGTVGVVQKDLPNTHWVDPLVAQPFTNRQLWYGGSIYGKEWESKGFPDWLYFSPAQIRNFFSVPLVTVLDEEKDWGITLGFSPEDIGIEAVVQTTREGKITFARHNNRISAERPLRFTTYLYAHEADWRPALGWYASRFKSLFDPVNPKANQMAGTGAYSWETKALDVDKLKKMAFRTNWDATFPFIYMGQFLPPVRDDEMWLSWRGLSTSFKTINDYYARMQADGFHVLSYFDVTEFGNYVVPKKDYVNRQDWRTQWVNCNKYLQEVIEPAVVYHPYDTSHTRYVYTYEKAVVVDPAEPVYVKFMLEQANRHLEKLPNFEGFAIDRMDWNRMYNTRRDDGIAWFNGQPARSLHTSWNIMMDSLHRLLHPRGKVIFINNHVKRLEQTRYADGVFDEFGYGGASINTNAFLCLNKTLIGWCYNKQQLGKDFDGYMQRYLHMGMFPMAPFPANDHAIQPDPEVDQLFIDYGQLFDALRGKRWVLQSRAVEVVASGAKANVFQTPQGYVIPVTFGGNQEKVDVRINLLGNGFALNNYQVEVIHPGESQWKNLYLNQLVASVPLKRGCAVVRLRKK